MIRQAFSILEIRKLLNYLKRNDLDAYLHKGRGVSSDRLYQDTGLHVSDEMLNGRKNLNSISDPISYLYPYPRGVGSTHSLVRGFWSLNTTGIVRRKMQKLCVCPDPNNKPYCSLRTPKEVFTPLKVAAMGHGDELVREGKPKNYHDLQHLKGVINLVNSNPKAMEMLGKLDLAGVPEGWEILVSNAEAETLKLPEAKLYIPSHSR